ncbi:MAG: glycine cleavage T C-terminal barrel domain-containing protein, partial [Steroidobacteraceae bacterium]
RENFVSVEHLKRYTTQGMAPDQGKTSNVNALAIMASLTGRSPPQVGTIRSRFPAVPMSLGALAGGARGQFFRPMRRLPLHDWHALHGAVFEEYSGWARPAHYLRSGELPADAEQREALAVRRSVGLFDASPLGKIEVVGPDAAAFLDRIYANTMSSLKVGRLRYGLMLNEHGVVIDDGVAARLGDDRFLVGTTSGGADRIALALEEWLQCEWSSMRVLVAPLTTSLAVLTLTGPKARDVLGALGVSFPIDAAAFPHMSFRDGHVGGVPARVSRVSFTGEMSFEIAVANSRSAQLWEAFMAVGATFGITPVGVDAWMLLRTEKGYLHIGADTDGSTSPDDIGWGHIHKRDVDFVGRRSLLRADFQRADRHQFVGFEPVDGSELRVGSHLRARAATAGTEGYVTSSGYSQTMGRWVALGMLRAGRSRIGEVLTTLSGQGRGPVLARVTLPGSYDLNGDRLRE